MSKRRVKLFRNGRNQVVGIPCELELPGENAAVRREGETLIVEPASPKSSLALLATLPALGQELPPITDPAPDPVEL